MKHNKSIENINSYYILSSGVSNRNNEIIATLYSHQFYIEDSILNIINSLFEQKYPLKKYIYTYDLDLYENLIGKYCDGYKLTSFRYQGVCYSITISNILYPRKGIIIKDLSHFFSAQTLTYNLATDFLALSKLYEEMIIQYKININNKYTLTAASLSMRIFKTRYNSNYSKIYQLNEAQYTYIKKAYYGGRNEIYKHLVEKNFYYDINSLYPFIMKTYDMPIKESIFRDEEYMQIFTENLDHFFGFLDVTVISPCNVNIPILPCRIENSLGIIYPLGIFRGSYFSEELKLAIKHGYKINIIHSAYEYKQKDILFKDFITEIYNKRTQTSCPILNDIYKKILNTLYGRFGLIYEKIESNKDIKTDDNYINENTTEFIDETSRTIYNNISITAAIASYARIYMYNILFDYNIDLIYIDTDGIFTAEPLPQHLISTRKEIGLFRLESINDMACFLACKMYFYKPNNKPNYTYKFKNIPKQHTIINTSKLLKRYTQNISTNSQQQILVEVLDSQKIFYEYSAMISHKRKCLSINNTKAWKIRSI